MDQTAVLIGNSDGIGLEFSRELLQRGWTVTGISRSESAIDHPRYRHIVKDVRQADYPQQLKMALNGGTAPCLCVYFAGIGELLDFEKMELEQEIFAVNLLGMVKTAAAVIPEMIKRGQGHFIGLSSVADVLLSAEAPSYHASKAGFTSYLESLALALKDKNVFVTNVRFGFVDTKMAKGDVKPFMLCTKQAVNHLLICLKRKPIRYTAPGIVIPLVNFRRLMMRFSG